MYIDLIIDQISVLSDQVNVDLYKEIESKNPVEIAKCNKNIKNKRMITL